MQPTGSQREPLSVTKRSKRQWLATSEARLKKGESYEALIKEIVDSGYAEHDAQRIIDEAIRRVNKRAGRVLGCSALLLIAGLAVTLLSLNTGVGAIWWGAIVCGLVGVFYGLLAPVKRR